MARKLVLKMSVSLDGFVGGPNGEVDWLFPSMDEGATAWVADTLLQAGVHLMGSQTYRDMAAYWPDSSHPFAAPMNDIPKFVFSSTMTEAAWGDTMIVDGDLRTEITRLKQLPGKYLLAHGGARFAQSLTRLGLVDEYRLMVHPVALGGGLPVFLDLAEPIHMKLMSTTIFPGCVAAMIYRPT